MSSCGPKMNMDPTLHREKKPRWHLVDFEHVPTFKEFLPLETLKSDAILSVMLVCQKGTRLSITPVEKKHFTRVLKLAGVSP